MAKYIRKQHSVEAIQLKYAIKMFIPVGKPIEGAVGDWLVVEDNGDQKIVPNEEFKRHFERYNPSYSPISEEWLKTPNEVYHKIPPITSPGSREALDRRISQDERKIKGEIRDIPMGEAFLPKVDNAITKPTLKDLRDIEQQYKEEKRKSEFRDTLYEARIQEIKEQLEHEND